MRWDICSWPSQVDLGNRAGLHHCQDDSAKAGGKSKKRLQHRQIRLPTQRGPRDLFQSWARKKEKNGETRAVCQLCSDAVQRAPVSIFISPSFLFLLLMFVGVWMPKCRTTDHSKHHGNEEKLQTNWYCTSTVQRLKAIGRIFWFIFCKIQPNFKLRQKGQNYWGMFQCNYACCHAFTSCEYCRAQQRSHCTCASTILAVKTAGLMAIRKAFGKRTICIACTAIVRFTWEMQTYFT